MEIRKIVHKGEERIKVDFPYNPEISSKLKLIADARWSNTLKSWTIPDKKEAFDLLISLFPELKPEPAVLKTETPETQRNCFSKPFGDRK